MNTATNEDLSEVVLLFAERAWPNCKLEMFLSLKPPPPLNLNIGCGWLASLTFISRKWNQ